jgi:hypothetical protein
MIPASQTETEQSLHLESKSAEGGGGRGYLFQVYQQEGGQQY